MSASPPQVRQRLSGQAAIVTGAGSGMGRAIAVALAREGARVALVARTTQALEETAQQVKAVGGTALIAPGDVGVEEDVSRAVATTREHFGRIDVLVNNAGTNVPRRLFSTVELADWERVLNTNLTGVFLFCRAVLPIMREQGGGLVVNISSNAGRQASIKAGLPYSVTKFGVEAITQMVNLEGWQHGVRATTIFPADTNTPILDLRPTPPPAELRADMLQVDDIASTVLFLATLPQRAVVEELHIRPTRRDI